MLHNLFYFQQWAKDELQYFQSIFGMKTVDKYQFNEDQPRFDSGIECFSAFHTVLKKWFTLKRIALNNEREEALSSYLTKEVSVLKRINHENAYRCHKMLKTKNNLYLIYDSIEGQSLADIPSLSPREKLSHLRRIVSLLLALHTLPILHLAINPQNIIILQDGSLKIINFGQAIELPSDKSWLPLSQPSSLPITTFSAPELLEGKAHINSDVFSLGVLLIQLFAEEFSSKGALGKLLEEVKKEQKLERRSIVFLKSLAEQMTIKLPDVRIGIVEIDRALRNQFDTQKSSNPTPTRKLTDVGAHVSPSKSSKSEKAIEEPKIRKNASSKNISQNAQEIVAESNTSLLLPSKSLIGSNLRRSNSGTEKVGEVDSIYSQIIRKRNFVHSLLLMSQTCLKNKEAKTEICIALAFLLLKKATICITQLAKLLKVGKGAEITLGAKQFEQFLRSQQFPTINAAINKEMGITKESLNSITREVLKLESFTSNTLLLEEVKVERINNSFLRKNAFEFMGSLELEGTLQYCSNYSTEEVVGIYLISLLSSFKTYEDAFEHLLSESPVHFRQEPLLQALFDLRKQSIFQFLQLDLQLNESKENDALSATKSTRTLH